MTSVEGLTCPKCGGTKINKEVWKSPRYFASFEVDKALTKWGMNCVKKLSCETCGCKWDAKTLKEMEA